MCVKCQQNELIRSVQDRGMSAEVWTGNVEGVGRVWYSVSAARAALARIVETGGVIGEADYEWFSVAMLWETQISKSEIVAEHLDHVNTAEPVFLVTTGETEQGDNVTLIDGNHRVARAHRDGVKFVKGLRFSLAFSNDIRIPPERAILEDLIQELLTTGAVVSFLDTPDGRVPVLSGGTLRPSGPDDHPLRAEIVANLKNGPKLVPLT